MRTLRITSKDNQTIKLMRQPEKQGFILVEGPKLLEEALAAGLTIEDLVVASSKLSHYNDLLQRLEKSGARLLEVPERIIAGIGDAITGQGIIGLAREPESKPEELVKQAVKNILVLDAIQDPGNVGAMIRSAFAFGISAVVALDGTANPFGSKAIRASAGACFHVPAYTMTAEDFLVFSRRNNLSLCALDAEAETDISEHAPLSDYAIIVGNEGAGIRTELLQACKYAFRIPIGEKLESLNAAVAASITLYELARKRAKA